MLCQACLNLSASSGALACNLSSMAEKSELDQEAFTGQDVWYAGN